MTLTKKEAPTFSSTSEVKLPDSPAPREEPSPSLTVYSFARDATFPLGDKGALKRSFRQPLSAYELFFGEEHIMVDIIFNFEKDEIRAEASLFWGASPNGATTSMYRGALSIMQAAADFYGKPVAYRFTAKDPEMKFWAISPYGGQGVFEWDEMGFYKGQFEATKRIIPISSTSSNGNQP